MWNKIQLGLLLTLAMSGSQFAAGAFAQNPHPDRPSQHQPAPAPRANTNRPPVQNSGANRSTAPNQTRIPNSDRPPSRPPQVPAGRDSQRNENRPPSATIGPSRPESFGSSNFNNRPNGPYDRPNGSPGARLTPRQQVGVGAARPFVDQMRDLSPQQRDRVLQNSRAFQNLAPEKQNRIRNQFNQWDRMTPQQRDNLRANENTWRRLTPEQRDHIRNDVMPKWRQLPWGRQQVIQQKLGVLQNMPESARNQRLADPNFTRGMSDEDKSMLHDLSHLHVGGAPDPPGNDQ